MTGDEMILDYFETIEECGEERKEDYDWLKEADEEMLYGYGIFPLPISKDENEAGFISFGEILDKLRDNIELSFDEKSCLSYYLNFLKDAPQNSILDASDEGKGIPFFEEIVYPYLLDMYCFWHKWITLNKDTAIAKQMMYKGMLIRFHPHDDKDIYSSDFASFSSDIYGLYDFTEGAYYTELDNENQKFTMIVTSTNISDEDDFGIALDDFINYLISIDFWSDDRLIVPGKLDEKEVLYKLDIDNIIVGKVIGSD